MVARMLYALSILAVVSAVWFVVSIFRVVRATRAKQQQLEWIKQEARRAVEQLESGDDDRVIAGLQTLGALKVSREREDALLRIAQLMKSDSPKVAEHAETTLSRILPPSQPRKPRK